MQMKYMDKVWIYFEQIENSCLSTLQNTQSQYNNQYNNQHNM